LGDLDGAIKAARDAVAVWRQGPWRTVFGYDLINLAGMLVERGELDEALDIARGPEGLAFARDRGVVWMFLDHFALCAALRGRFEDAARLEGHAAYGHAAAASLRQANEARAQARLMGLLDEALPAKTLARLRAEGARLSADEACRLALDQRLS
jgi:hypothetical protein